MTTLRPLPFRSIIGLGAAFLLATTFTQAQEYDLAALPPYQPAQQVQGVIRIHGTELTLNLVRLWEKGFLKHQAVVRYGDYFVPTPFSGLCAGTAEIGVSGHTAWRSDLKAFEGAFGYDPLEVMFATGGFNLRKGNTPGAIIFVNKDNPISGLTLRQLDGIFGAERCRWLARLPLVGSNRRAGSRGQPSHVMVGRPDGRMGRLGQIHDLRDRRDAEQLVRIDPARGV